MYTIKIDFKGGILHPAELYNILLAASRAGLHFVRFGLRQQLMLEAEFERLEFLEGELNTLGIGYEINGNEFPNVSSSFPAEEVFINDTWLNAGIYREVLDAINYRPRLKINISDANQSFTPLLTGNINWVASPTEIHFWHLFIRFPKTNIIYEWEHTVHTNNVGALSAMLEDIIMSEKAKFYDNNEASGAELFNKIDETVFETKPAGAPLKLPDFNLPYYEGLNRYRDKYWMGIYRRDELFGIPFLKEVCQLCLESENVQLCSTPWKTIIIKGISEDNKEAWSSLLDKYQINIRHAANELNFQVEDNSFHALKLKQLLVKHLNDDDTRTFGICIGIKTRKKSEVFSNILVRRKSLFTIGRWRFFNTYDILCAKDYNPNERTDFIFSSGNPKFVLAEQVRRAVLSYYKFQRPELFYPELHEYEEAPPGELL